MNSSKLMTVLSILGSVIAWITFCSSVQAQVPEAGAWRQIGPGPIHDLGAGQLKGAGGTLSGLVTDIAIDPSGAADNTIFVATDAGGVWKSIDGGQSWQPKTDFMPTTAIGAVVLDPNNPQIVYAGSGNQANPGDASGAGVFKSTDGGETWTVLNPGNLLTGAAVSRMAMPELRHPSSGLILGIVPCDRGRDQVDIGAFGNHYRYQA